MSIRIKFSRSELHDRAATILGLNRSQIVSVCPTFGGKTYLILVGYGKAQTCQTFSIWQLVEALPLQSHNIAADLLLSPTELLESLSFMGLSMVPDLLSLKRSYRQLSKQYHPDKGGSAEDFQKLKVCFDKIKPYVQG